MSFGIGLGAFVEGFEKGARMRVAIDQYREQKGNRAALADVEAGTRAEFDKQVEAGQQNPDDYASFWKQYGLPKRVNELLKQGKIEDAAAYQKWGESDAALQGGKLFSSALLKAQTGDFAGALSDVSKAGKVKGYNDSGIDVLGQTPLPAGADGVSPGFRIQLRDGNGRTFEQDVLNGDLPRLIATFGNPDAAFAASQEARSKAAEGEKKRKDEITDYRAKKEIDKEFKEPDKSKDNDFKKDYAAAAETRAKTDYSWNRKTKEEQDQLIRADLEAARRYAEENGQTLAAGNGATASPSPQPGAAAAGSTPAAAVGTPAGIVPASPAPGSPAQSPAQPVAPGAQPRIVIDTKTGKPVEAPQQQAAPAQQPAGLGVQRGPPVGIGGPSGQAMPAPLGERDQLLNEAAAEAAQGGNPEQIGMRLYNAGIPQEEWPDALKAAAARRASGQAMGVQ